MSTLLKVSLRYQAIYIPDAIIGSEQQAMKETTAVLIANLRRLGFVVSEPLLKALNQSNPKFQLRVLEYTKQVMGTNKNWTPLVKGWDEPTGTDWTDHVMTFFTNLFQAKGTSLPCGHIIPGGTFPLERYNGCPYCGTTFEFGKLNLLSQGSKYKTLELWQDEQIADCFKDLLASKTALDATQMDSLKILLAECKLPDTKIAIKETLMAVISELIKQGKTEEAQVLFQSPNDILRYLWFKHTGFYQIISPKTIVKRTKANAKAVYLFKSQDKIEQETAEAKFKAAADLKLKYSRKECLMAAQWLNALEMDIMQMCESMHPKRGMWVRFIRALRLSEYAKRKGFEKLKALLDAFYNELYDVWQGRVNFFRLKTDVASTMKLLQQRPGLFARSLFANMLWFGQEPVIAAFSEIIDKVPARLVFTLNMYAQFYFDPNGDRSVKPLGGINKRIPKNQLLQLYTGDQLEEMKQAIERLCLLAMKKRFASMDNEHKTMFIDPMLFKMPVSIGDRSETVQDLPSALMGARFELEGQTVRLFMQWGQGLPAQRLDMDLSCQVAYDNRVDRCSYSQLTITGCQHSGDILEIPNQVGTAEYIELNLPQLEKSGAKFVTFTCNAYSKGSIAPNLVVGWMNSAHPMTISKKTGVAYDPSCVQHQVRILQNLTKGLVFGVLDVKAREIIWLEMSFGGQVLQNLDYNGVQSLLQKLNNKLSIGNLLKLKAEAQDLELVETNDADEIYDQKWAINSAAVTQLLVD